MKNPMMPMEDPMRHKMFEAMDNAEENNKAGKMREVMRDHENMVDMHEAVMETMEHD